jgi:hypothetical protein
MKNSAPRRSIARPLAFAILLLAGLGFLGRSLADLGRHMVAPAFAEDGGKDSGDGGDSGGGDGGGSGGGGDGSSGSGGSGDDGGDNSGSSGSSGNSGGTGSPMTGPAATAGTTADGTGTGGHRRDFAAGEVVVVGDGPKILAKAEDLGFRLIDDRPLAALGLSVLRLQTPPNVGPEQGLSLLHQALPQLVADVNTLYEPYKTQSAQVVSLPAPDYARHLIGWSGGANCGTGFRIGMVDTGIDADLPALAGQKLHQQSFLAGDASPAATEHGTSIAALLIGRSDPGHIDGGGLLPAADLYAASIFERHGERVEASAFAIAAALDWMVAQHVPVVNISLSGDNNALMALAVARATERGTMLVAAAGNAGPTAPPAYPAALEDVIAVTAVDQNEAILPEANQGDYIAFAAPGVRVWTPAADGLGQYQTGTSFAAPFAAAAIAAERMAGSPPDVSALRARLAAHALDLGPPGKDPIFGYGLIRATTSCEASASAG